MMGFHTFDPSDTARLADPSRFRFCSREELLQQLPTESETRLLDVGSGIGFYTNELTPFVDEIVALDIQSVMHRQYHDRGMPENVRPVTADAGSLPFEDASFDGIVSTMTFHESASESALVDLHRVLRPDAPAAIVDWSAAGRGESGPPLSERFDADAACELLGSAGFEVQTATERSETFLALAVRPDDSQTK
jgi:ubiquinone/menaquinone biosynthesis C-methylase UbiE